MVSTFTTPSGTPASAISCAISSAVSGVSLAGLTTTAQPAASAGAILRVAIAAGKFHGVISSATPTGLRKVRIRLAPDGAVRSVAVDTDRLLAEPTEELRGVGDLAAGVGERLAHLQRHEVGEILAALGHQFEGLAQCLGTGAWRSRGPLRLGGRGCGERRVQVVGAGPRDLAERLAGGRIQYWERRRASRLARCRR